jgi:hypothetical protein
MELLWSILSLLLFTGALLMLKEYISNYRGTPFSTLN